MPEMFKLGGWGMWLTLFTGLALLAASVRYAVSPERRFLPLVVSLGCMTLFSGGLGFTTGLIQSFFAVDRVPADQRYIAIIGVAESLHNVAFSLAIVMIASIAVTAGTWRIARAPEGRVETA